MDSLTDILNSHLYPYEEKIVSFECLTIIDNIKQTLGRGLPEKGRDIINSVSKPIRNDNIGFIYCYSGEIVCRINMIEYRLMRDDLLFIHENAIVEIIINDLNVNVICLIIGKDYHPANVEMTDYLALHVAMAKYPLVHLNGRLSANILNTCRQMEEVMAGRRDIFSADLTKAYLKIFYIYCAMAFNELSMPDDMTHSPRKSLILRQFLNLVERYFINERQVSFYAGKLCLAPKYMSQVIKQASGKIAGEWIQERVILEAKLLLVDGHHNVQQVSDALNFSSQSFFGKYFKSATGMSPKAYMAANKDAKSDR